MQVGNNIAAHPNPCQVPSPKPVLPIEWWQLVKVIDLPPRQQPQVLSGTDGLPKHPLTQGVPLLDSLEIHMAEKLLSPRIQRRQPRHTLHPPHAHMRVKGHGVEELQTTDRPAKAVEGAVVA